MLLMALQSIYILRVPSFFGTKMTRIAYGLKLSLNHPFSVKLSTFLWIAFVSFRVLLYVALFGKEAPGMRSIWFSTPFKGGVPLDLCH